MKGTRWRGRSSLGQPRRPRVGAVGRWADEGDRVARETIAGAAAELVVGVRSVAERLGMRGGQFPPVLAGSIFRVPPAPKADVIERVAEVVPRSQPRMLDAEPALGAV